MFFIHSFILMALRQNLFLTIYKHPYRYITNLYIDHHTIVSNTHIRNEDILCRPDPCHY